MPIVIPQSSDLVRLVVYPFSKIMPSICKRKAGKINAFRDISSLTDKNTKILFTLF